MSKASDYAAAVASREALLGAPPPFVSPNVRSEVTTRGSLFIVATGSNPEVSPNDALGLRDWLTLNFA